MNVTFDNGELNLMNADNDPHVFSIAAIDATHFELREDATAGTKFHMGGADATTLRLTGMINSLGATLGGWQRHHADSGAGDNELQLDIFSPTAGLKLTGGEG